MLTPGQLPSLLPNEKAFIAPLDLPPEPRLKHKIVHLPHDKDAKRFKLAVSKATKKEA